MLPYSKASDKAARVLSDQEVSILDIEAIDRAGNKLHVQGMLMGTLPTDMYVGAYPPGKIQDQKDHVLNAWLDI